MSSCTSSSPCTGTVGTSNISGSVSASINYYTLTLTKGSGVSTIYYKTSSSSSYTSSTSTVQISVPYGTTYNYYATSNTGYTMNSCTSSSICSVIMGTSSVSKTLSATVNQYTLSITKGTGVGTIYYKINGASSYSSTTSNASLSVNYGTTYYYYGSPSSEYYMTSCTSSSPCSGTMTTSGASVSLVAYEAVYQLYNSSGTSTGYATGLSSAISNVSSGGTVKALKSNTSSAVTVSKNVTINTNGYTITMTDTLTNSLGYTLSITGNGKIYSTASLDQFILTNGTTNLTSATIYCTSCSNAAWVHGTFNMYSGTVRGGNGNGFMVSAATLNIYGGTIVGDTASGIKFYGGNLKITTSASDISVSGLLYGILAGSAYANSDIVISGNTGEGPYIDIFATSTTNSYVAALCINPDSSYSYSSTVEIGGAALYSYGYGVSNGVSSTMTITKNVIIESKNYTLLNKNIMYLGYNSTSSTLDSSIDEYVTIANANNTYAIYNYANATIYMGGGTYVYDTRDTSSYTSDNTKKPFVNYGTINLNGGRIYYSYGVASAFYNLGSGKVNASGWGYYTGTYTYKFRYYTAGTSYTIKRYSYKKS